MLVPPPTDSSPLAGFRGIRADVLVALKKSQPVSATELGDTFNVTANAIRRHLKELEAAGLVRARKEIRGVGGPTLLYSLTEGGEALFPRAYETTLTTLLDTVRAERGTDGIVELFRAQWERVAGGAKESLAALPLAERTQLLAELLTSHGYMAEASGPSEVNEALLREHNCVLRAVAEKFPEVCVAEERFLEEFLGAVVERRLHIASGASCCEYCIRESGIGERESEAGSGQRAAGSDRSETATSRTRI